MNLTPEAQKKFDAIVAAQVEKSVAARMATLPPTTPVVTGKPVAKMGTVARVGLYLAKQYAEGVGQKDGHFPEAARKAIIEKANAELGVATQGGGIYAPEFATEVIGALHELSVLKAAGATNVSWDGASLTFGKLNQGVTLGWTTETAAPTPANVETADLTLSNKYLKGYASISNALLRAKGPDFASILGADVLMALAAEVDAKFIAGAGTLNTPTGIHGQIAAGQSVAITATPNITKVRKDLANAMQRVRAAKLHFAGASPAWIMPSVEFFSLLAARDGAGNAFPSLEGASPTLFGAPVYVTDAVTDKVTFGLFRHVLWGSSFGPEMGMGLINTDLVQGVQTIYTHFVGDVALRYDKALAVITGTSAWNTLA